MSRKNNVNPDHYKVAGRDRPNEDIPPGPVVPDAKRASRSTPAPNHIPGAAPVGEKPKGEDEDENDT